MDTKTLNRNIKSFWTRQNNVGHEGLKMLDASMKHWAEHGDWTPLARFLALSGKEKSSLWMVVKCSFGAANVESKADKKSEFGFRLARAGSFKEHGDGFPLDQQNGYGIIRDAIDNGKSFRSADFLKQVRETVQPAKDKADKSVIDELTTIVKYIEGKMKDEHLKVELNDHLEAIKRRLGALEAREKAAFEPDH